LQGGFGQILVRRRDHPHIHGDRLLAAEPLDHARLEHAQQLRLGLGPEVADLVEKQRAAVRELEPPHAPLGGACERAALSWPNISDSTRSFGIAALFTHTNGFAARPALTMDGGGDELLPVPDSPVINTRTSVGATRAISARSCSIALLTPTSGSACPSASCSRRFSRACAKAGARPAAS